MRLPPCTRPECVALGDCAHRAADGTPCEAPWVLDETSAGAPTRGPYIPPDLPHDGAHVPQAERRYLEEGGK